MAQINWAAAVSGNFTDAADWTGGVVPGATDDAILGGDGTAYTVTATASQTVNTIQTAANTTLSIDQVNFTATNGGVNAGTILVYGLGQSLSIAGAFVNTGTIRGVGYSNIVHIYPGNLDIGDNTVLSGGGVVANFLMLFSGGIFTNVDNTIENTTIFGSVINDPNGTIIANITGLVTNYGTIENSSFGNGTSEAYNYGTAQNCSITGITNHGVILGGQIGLPANQTTPPPNAGLDNTGTILNSAIACSFTNSGLIAAAGGASLSFSGITANDVAGGTIEANGGAITLSGGTLIGGVLATLAGGVLTLDGSSASETLESNVSVAPGGTIGVLGTLINLGDLGLEAGAAATLLSIGATPVYFTGGGAVILGGAGAGIVGLASGDTLTNVDNTISGGGAVGGGSLILVNQAGGVIIGDLAAALTIDTGTNVIANAGEIANAGAGGTIVRSAVDNTGALVADGGTLTLGGAVTGSGTGAIYAGTLDAAASFDQNVAFAGASGTLELAQSQSYGAAIVGFSKTGATTLDLDDIAFGGSTTASYAGTTSSGVLTVTDGAHTAHITLIGDYTSSTFKVSSDGHGGTTVVDPKAHAQPHAFIAAMASFAAPAAGAIAATDAAVSRPALLATPRTAQA